jgi:hypothetical protein
MITIDGKPLDLTDPSSWGESVKLRPGGSIETETVKWVCPVKPQDNAMYKTADGSSARTID